ncbi:MAG: hypothetical protein II859_01730 [Bacteroidales bacterium]|nr:hypothetical protein [Bacteroidales bacterium]
MIEILLTDLNKENFYEETLKKIESICDDYAMDDQFGTLSMANQMVCDYLESQSSVMADVSFRLDGDEVLFEYTLQNGNFRAFSNGQNDENTGMFVLSRLADEIIFSTDYDTLTTTFHVKTRISVHRNLQKAEVKNKIFS